MGEDRVMIKKIKYSSEINLEKELARSQFSYDDVNETVENILKDVRSRGDKALIEYTEKFDGVKLETLEVSDKEIEDAYNTAIKLLQYYNCQAVLESTRVSILTYFRSKNVANSLLMKRPRACLSDVTNGKSNMFGAQATEIVIKHQLDLIARYIENYYNEL